MRLGLDGLIILNFFFILFSELNFEVGRVETRGTELDLVGMPPKKCSFPEIVRNLEVDSGVHLVLVELRPWRPI